MLNDAPGLRRTIESIRRLLPQIEYWIIDGSTTGDVRELVASLGDDRINLLSEPDDGLYDAMNKGRERVTSDYLLFLNAGDVFVPQFDPERFLADGVGRVIIGFSAERYASDRFLRPARSRAVDALTSPAHQATAYPREAYSQLAFDTSMPIKADGDLTRRAIEQVGGVVVGELVPESSLAAGHQATGTGGSSGNGSETLTVAVRLRSCRRKPRSGLCYRTAGFTGCSRGGSTSRWLRSRSFGAGFWLRRIHGRCCAEHRPRRFPRRIWPK